MSGKSSGIKPKKTLGDIIFDILNYSFLLLFTLICVFPFYYIFINTISANNLVSTGQILLLPRGIHFGNYIQVFSIKGLPLATFVTIARTVIGTGLTTVCTAFIAFAIARKELWHRKLWYRFFLITMYFNAGLIPWYITMKNLGLLNNFLAYIIGVVNPFNMILLKTYIENTPLSLQESAEIDGASYLSIFFRILMPLCAPILATVTVFTAVGHWNSFMDTVMLMTDSRLFTLQYLLYQYLSEAQALAASMKNSAMSGAVVIPKERLLTPSSVRMTISMVVVLPILFVYPFFQRYFTKGIMIGAVKG